MTTYSKMVAILAIGLMMAAAVSAEVPIPANYQVSTPSYRLQNEEQIMVSPVDSNVLIADWRDFRLGYRQVGVGRSADGGATWSDQLIPVWQQKFDRQSDPALTVDADGNFYVCVLDYQSSSDVEDSSYVSILKSTDDGLTWTGPVTVEDSIGPYFEDKEFITCDRTGGAYHGNLYVTWSRWYPYYEPPPRIFFSRSTDAGASFGDTLLIGPNFVYNNGSDTAAAGNFPQPIVGSDGSVYVFWKGYDEVEPGTTMNAILMVKSIDGGLTWTDEETVVRTVGHWYYVDGNIEAYNAPAGAADISGGAFDGNVYISYANIHDQDSWDFDIQFVRTLDGGQTWSEPIIINDDYNDGPNPPYDQFHPWLYCNDEGILVIIFYDQRIDSLNHYKFDVFAAYSFDGGETFTGNHRITEVSSSPDDLKSTRNLTFTIMDSKSNVKSAMEPMAGKIAEYIGVAAFKHHINAVWTDARNGNQDVFGANWVIPRIWPNIFIPRMIGQVPYVIAGDTIRWTGYDLFDNVTYRLQIDNDSAFASPMIDSAIATNYIAADDLPTDRADVYSRVKVYWPDGDSTQWSRVRDFLVRTATPSMATGLDPDEDTVLWSPVALSWTADYNPADEYFDIELSDDSLFSGSGLYRLYDMITSNAMAVSPPFISQTNYYWRVNHLDIYGNESGYSPTASFHYLEYVCGDPNGDIDVNISDAVYLIAYIFKGGPAPFPLEAGDVNNDEDINITDAVYLINYIFKGGPPPDCS